MQDITLAVAVAVVLMHRQEQVELAVVALAHLA
jgi:hypothetical protein